MRALAAAAVAVAAVFLLAGEARTQPICEITYTGPSPGSWHTLGNWDLGRVPAAGDDVCIPTGKTVQFTTGTTSVSSVQGAGTGTLAVSGGTLDITDVTDATLPTLNLSGGTIGGAGTLTLTGAGSTWSGGTMDGAGTTTVAAGGTLTRSGVSSVFLANGRTLDAQGTFALSVAQTIFNSGTAGLIHVSPGGTMQRTATAGIATVNPAVENDGTVRVAFAGGEIDLTGGSAGGSSTGDYGSAGSPAGAIEFTSGTHVLGDGASFLDGVDVSGATVNVAAGETASASGVTGMDTGTIGGTGTFDITGGTFTWSGGSFDGAGTTNVAAGATLKRAGANSAFVSQGRQVEVQGTLDLSVAQTIFNSGTVGLIHIAAGG